MSAYQHVEQLIRQWNRVSEANPDAELRIRNTSRLFDTLVELPPLPANLRKLWLENLPMLRNLPPLPPTLWKMNVIDCPRIPAEDFVDLPQSLRRLDLRRLNLTDLSVLPKELEILSVDCLDIPSMPEGFNSLIHLSILRAHAMTSLTIPPSVLYLELEGLSKLMQLPTLPTGLRALTLNHIHSLQELPEFPATMEHLSVRFTPLTMLPVLPTTLKTVTLGRAQLPDEFYPGYDEYTSDWVARINPILERYTPKWRTQQRCGIIREELMMKAFAPPRVARWLGEGTEREWALVDAIMGIA